MELSITVKEPTGDLRPFLRDKLLISIYESLKHRKSALADATALTSTIISLLYSHAESAAIEKAVIIEVTITALERFDPIAATYYKAFHVVAS